MTTLQSQYYYYDIKLLLEVGKLKSNHAINRLKIITIKTSFNRYSSKKSHITTKKLQSIRLFSLAGYFVNKQQSFALPEIINMFK